MAKSIMAWLFGDPLHNAEDKLHRAVREQARRAAEVHYHTSMLQFYNNRADAIIPAVDWWGYAEAMQNAANHRQDRNVEERRLTAADAKVVACAKRVDELREAP